MFKTSNKFLCSPGRKTYLFSPRQENLFARKTIGRKMILKTKLLLTVLGSTGTFVKA